MWWQISLALLLLGGAVAFIGDTFTQRAVAKQNAAVAKAVTERNQVNTAWQAQARKEADEGDARVKERDAEIDQLKLQLNQRRPAYVSPLAVKSCTLTAGVVQQHNDAAGGRAGIDIQPSAGFAPDRPSGVGIDRYSAVVESNYTTCHKYIKRSREWQRWAAQSCRTWNEKYKRNDDCPAFPGGVDAPGERKPEGVEPKGK